MKQKTWDTETIRLLAIIIIGLIVQTIFSIYSSQIFDWASIGALIFRITALIAFMYLVMKLWSKFDLLINKRAQGILSIVIGALMLVAFTIVAWVSSLQGYRQGILILILTVIFICVGIVLIIGGAFLLKKSKNIKS